MIRDAEERDDTWFSERVFDICIVGSGPAGICLARSLARRGWNVGLFEAGGFNFSSASQDLYAGPSVGQPYFPLTSTRLRYLGGSSGHWAGWCYELDESDFMAVEGRTYSGWPITKADLDTYRAVADEMLDLDPPEAPPEYLRSESQDFEPFSYRLSPPTRFGQKYRRELEQSENINTFLHANLVDIELEPDLAAVRRFVFRSYDRPDPFHVSARYYALCLGGLENPRALLNANRQVPSGIGNEHDLVGRFFTEHINVDTGDVLFEQLPGRVQYFKPTDAFMRREGIGNFGLQLRPTGVPTRSSWALREVARTVVCSTSFTRRLAETIRRGEVQCVDGTGSIRILCEQMLNPDSRVRLGDDVDRFGLNVIELDWQLSEAEIHTLRTATTEFAQLMAEQRLGRVRPTPWVMESTSFDGRSLSDVRGGNHHMCTTRMGEQPQTSVVDPSCRVHSVSNLYLGGSSVFGTAGWANPTYTIVQLAFRLADHLHDRLVGEQV